MPLSNIQLVRYGIGDTTLPYKIADADITSYLAIYSDAVDDTIVALRKNMLALIAANSGQEIIGDFEHDTRDAPKSYLSALKYIQALEQQASPVAKYGFPIIGNKAIPSDLKIGTNSDLDFDETADKEYFANNL